MYLFSFNYYKNIGKKFFFSSRILFYIITRLFQFCVSRLTPIYLSFIFVQYNQVMYKVFIYYCVYTLCMYCIHRRYSTYVTPTKINLSVFIHRWNFNLFKPCLPSLSIRSKYPTTLWLERFLRIVFKTNCIKDVLLFFFFILFFYKQEGKFFCSWLSWKGIKRMYRLGITNSFFPIRTILHMWLREWNDSDSCELVYDC